VAEIVKATATRVGRAHPTLQFDLTSAPDTLAAGDAFLLSQLFYNLIDNAAKYGDDRHPVDCVIGDGADGAIVVTITDRGPGVAPQDRARVFDKFYRSSFTDHKQAGSGLGLAISRAITLSHGGDIRVADRDDGLDGAQFVVTLPRAQINPMDSNEGDDDA
jgi:two-component system sensor histidine kinase KdpD